MSLISTTHHKVTPFTKESKAFQNNVLLRIIAKGASKESIGESKCVSVPVILQAEIFENVNKLMPAIEGLIHDARQQIARKLIIDGLTEIPTESISLAACTDWLVDETSGRVTTQVLQEWFTESYSQIAMEFVCKQIKFDVNNLSPEQEKVIMQKTNVIRDVFAGFASGKYTPALPVCKMIIGFGTFCAEQIDTRLQSILDKTAKIRDKQLKMLDMDFAELLESIPAPVEKTAKSVELSPI